jgi:hypothetical protein
MKKYFCEWCGTEHFKPRSRFCSDECRSLYRKSKPNPCLGRKQSKETIEKRIRNTDQKAKQAKLRSTMLERYGVENVAQLLEVKEAISLAAKNRPRDPRSAEHSRKIAENRKINGTNKHTQKTKDWLRETMLRRYSDPDLDRSIHVAVDIKSWHKSGRVDAIYFRSSYEEKFLLFCKKFNIEVISAANKEFAVPYMAADGRIHHYFPDFYLPNYHTIVEIKPISLLNVYPNDVKIDAGLKHHENFVILTEIDDFFDEVTWQPFYEEIVNNWIK